MRIVILLALLVAGCAITGSGTGFSNEAETSLRALAPEMNREFGLAGSSLELGSGRELSVLVRDEAMSALQGPAQETQARAIADWIWKHGGKDAGVSTVALSAVGERMSDQQSRKYRFGSSDLESP